MMCRFFDVYTGKLTNRQMRLKQLGCAFICGFENFPLHFVRHIPSNKIPLENKHTKGKNL